MSKEAKLGIYQLAAAQPVPTLVGSRPSVSTPTIGGTPTFTPATTTKGLNWWQRNNINAGSVIGRVNDLIGIAGGVNNLIASFKKGEPMQIGNQTVNPQEAELLYKMALANQQAGGGQAGNEAMMNMMQQNQQMMQMFIMSMMGGNKNNDDKPKSEDNTMLYVGVGVGVLLLVGVVVAVAMKK